METMKKTIVLLTLLLVLISYSTLVNAESPAYLKTTVIKGGLGIHAKIKNVGNMTATNITCTCLVTGRLTNRTLTILKGFTKINPRKELTVYFLFLFLGEIHVGVGASEYFNGVEQVNNYSIQMYDAFAIGPFVKMIETPA